MHLNGIKSTQRNGKVIEYDGPTWLIPASRTKKSREHGVPLSAQMLALMGAPKASGLVFTTTNTASGAVNVGSLLKLLKKLRPNVEITTHGFRATFATWAEQQKTYSTKAIDLCLAHQWGTATTRAYHRADLYDERRAPDPNTCTATGFPVQLWASVSEDAISIIARPIITERNMSSPPTCRRLSLCTTTPLPYWSNTVET